MPAPKILFGTEGEKQECQQKRKVYAARRHNQHDTVQCCIGSQQMPPYNARALPNTVMRQAIDPVQFLKQPKLTLSSLVTPKAAEYTKHSLVPSTWQPRCTEAQLQQYDCFCWQCLQGTCQHSLGPACINHKASQMRCCILQVSTTTAMPARMHHIKQPAVPQA